MNKIILIILAIFLGACSTAKIDKALALDEDKLLARYNIAEKSYQQRDYSAAKKLFEAIVDEDEMHVPSIFRLANIAMREQDLETSKKHYNRVIELFPAHAKAHYNLAVLYLFEAERHMQFFTAMGSTTNPGGQQDIVKLLKAIDLFAKSKYKNTSPLDSLADMFKNE